MAYGGKGRLNGIGRAQVAPMRGRKIVEGKEVVFIFAQAFTGLGIFSSIERDKLIISLESLSLGISQIHLVDQVFGFALLAFGALFGFVGVLLAVPLAAVIGVLIRFAVGRYLESPYYMGSGNGDGGQA